MDFQTKPSIWNFFFFGKVHLDELNSEIGILFLYSCVRPITNFHLGYISGGMNNLCAYLQIQHVGLSNAWLSASCIARVKLIADHYTLSS